MDKNNIQIMIDDIEKKCQDSRFFNFYIKKLNFLKNEKNIAYFNTIDQYSCDELNNKYKDIFIQTIKEKFNENCDVIFLFKKSEISNENNYEKTLLNPLQNFDNYINGEFNSIPIKIIKEMEKDNPGWNLLYLSGGVGYGKTHLVNAFGNFYFKNHPDKKIIYYNNEEIYSQIYKIINYEDKIEEFKKELYSYDIVIIDDIQQFVDKNRINDLFFNLINQIILRGNKIIVASDRSPMQLVGIDQRNVSRLSQGMLTSITKPTINDIKEIINFKFKKWNEQFSLTNESIEFLASRVGSDIRKIDGLYTTISFFLPSFTLENNIITKDVLKKIIIDNKSEDLQHKLGISIDPEYVINVIANYFNESIDNIKSESRKKELVHIRDICMYILLKEFSLKLQFIGKIFANRRHSSVIESINRVEKKIKDDTNYKQLITNLVNKVK